MNFAWLPLQRQKCQVCEEGWYCGAPQNPLQTPRVEPPVWSYFEQRGDACLPHRGPATPYSCVDFRGRLTHQTQQKVKLKAPPFLDMGARLMFAGVHCHEKKEKKTGTALYSLLWCREWIPLQLVPNVHTKKKQFKHIKDQCAIFFIRMIFGYSFAKCTIQKAR